MPKRTPADFTLPYATQRIGNVTTPLVVESANTLLQDADPAIYFALDFWAALIDLHQGDRLVAAAREANVPDVTKPVMQRYPWAPDLEKESAQFKFPLLAVYRKDSKYEQKEISWQRDNCAIDLLYILPPLLAPQMGRIAPIFRAIEGTIRRSTSDGFDPNYAPPGGQFGEQPWSAPYAAVEEIGFERGHYGVWTGGEKLLRFPFLHMEGYIIERDQYVPMPNKLAGVDTGLQVFGADGTTVALASLASELSPVTITGISVSTGPQGGGTAVVITGTNFVPGVQFGPAQLSVMFGGFPAASVTWTSPTSITAVTPAMLGTGSVPIVLVNPDGRSAVAPTQFTFQ